MNVTEMRSMAKAERRRQLYKSQKLKSGEGSFPSFSSSSSSSSSSASAQRETAAAPTEEAPTTGLQVFPEYYFQLSHNQKKSWRKKHHRKK